MGDGNHSLATAKSIWEKIKPEVGLDHPARYALVEIENIHDEGLEFEPIHRVLFNFKRDILAVLQEGFGSGTNFKSMPDIRSMTQTVEPGKPGQAGLRDCLWVINRCGGDRPSNLEPGCWELAELPGRFHSLRRRREDRLCSRSRRIHPPRATARECRLLSALHG